MVNGLRGRLDSGNWMIETLRGSSRRRRVSVGGLLLLLWLLCISPAPAVGAEPAHVVSPLPASDYSVRRVCPPAARGDAICLALQLVPETPAARSFTHPLAMARTADGTEELCSARPAWEGCVGLRPQDLHNAYDLPDAVGASPTQTVALVDAYDDPTAESDLRVFDEEMELAACTSENGCFMKVNQGGKPRGLPKANGEWAFEISMDVEAAHAICQNCRILLVEARSDRVKDLEKAEERAVTMGATEISNSWTVVGPTSTGVEPAEPSEDSPAFNHPGIVITAASGDWGYLNAALEPSERGPNYPASSPHVVAVGGTHLVLNGSTGTWKSESVWDRDDEATGSGCSEHFMAPPWQQALSDWSLLGCEGHRAVADISADADPQTGMAMYDSTRDQGRVPNWTTAGGTSVASPIIAAAFALAGGAAGVEYPAKTMYEDSVLFPGSFHDVTTGSNGPCPQPLEGQALLGCTPAEAATSCSERAICVAGAGYDGPSGLGTPDDIGAFQLPSAHGKKTQLIQFASTPPQVAVIGGPPYTVTANASSGLAVELSSAKPSVCSLSGDTVSFVGAGACVINARQEGDPEYAAAAVVSQSIVVERRPQLIQFSSVAPTGAIVGGAAYVIAASASSALPVGLSTATPSVCSVSGSAVSFIGAGTCTIDAVQQGDGEYAPAQMVSQSFAVAPAAAPTSTTGTGSSATLSFTSSLPGSLIPTPNSSFQLLGQPHVDRRSGAITFTATVSDPGIFTWVLTFPNARFGAFGARRRRTCLAHEIKLAGRCLPAIMVFARGATSLTAPGTVRFTVLPTASAREALVSAQAKRHGLPVSASLTYHSSLGGIPSAQRRSIADRVAGARSKHRT